VPPISSIPTRTARCITPPLLRPGDRAVPTLDVAKGATGDAAMTARFCADGAARRHGDLGDAVVSEPDYTGHQSPLGSPAHRRAIAAADACVRQVAETVAALDPSGERILLLVGSRPRHGDGVAHRRSERAADRGRAQASAGLTRCRDRAAGHLGAALFRRADGEIVARVARFLEAKDWSARPMSGRRYAGIGMPADGALRIAISFAADDSVNPHGVRAPARPCAIPRSPRTTWASASTAGWPRTSSGRS